jgi:hypothetical protein
MEIQLHTFLNSALGRGGWSVSRSASGNFCRYPLGYLACLDVVVNKKVGKTGTGGTFISINTKKRGTWDVQG